MGRGDWSIASFKQFRLASIIPRGKPDVIPYGSVQISTIPASSSYSVLDSSSTVKVAFSMPANAHGANITNFLVEWFDTKPTAEVWEIQISGLSSISGSFRLYYNGDVSDYIPNDASADRLRVELESLRDIRGVQVSKDLTQLAANGYVWSVTFLSDYPTVFNRAITIDSTPLRAVGLHANATAISIAAHPHGFNSAMIDTSGQLKSLTYIIPDLHSGVRYYVYVTPQRGRLWLCSTFRAWAACTPLAKAIDPSRCVHGNAVRDVDRYVLEAS